MASFFVKISVLHLCIWYSSPCRAEYTEVKMFGKDGINNCGFHRSMIGGVITAMDDGSKEDYFSYNCLASLKTVANMRFNVRFERFKIIANDPRTCGNNRLEIYDGFNNTDDRLTSSKGLCSDSMNGNGSSSLPPQINTVKDGITFHLTRKLAPLAEFRIIVTSFHNKSEGYCFPCVNDSDSMCIHHSLTCDGVKNCINGSDEDVLGPCRDDISTLVDLSEVRLMMIVGVCVVLFVAVSLVVGILVGYFVHRRRKSYDVELHDAISVDSMYSTEMSETYSRFNSISSRSRHLADLEGQGSTYSTPVMTRNHALANGNAMKEERIELSENVHEYEPSS
ncbi:uncharacterized protein LOC144438942 [Glandiceps talaboti]